MRDTIIREYVRRYESYEAAEEIYCSSVGAMKGLKLQDILAEDIEQIVRPFLYQWGRMGRVLGQSKFANWKEKLAHAIVRDGSLLRRYAASELADTNLTPEKLHIERLYESFRDAVGQVAATKCLHLICPGFFPMWDTTIAGTVRKEGTKRESGVDAAKEFSGEEFSQFMGQVRDFVLGNRALLSSLAQRYGKTSVKIADEVFWWATQRPLSLIL